VLGLQNTTQIYKNTPPFTIKGGVFLLYLRTKLDFSH